MYPSTHLDNTKLNVRLLHQLQQIKHAVYKSTFNHFGHRFNKTPYEQLHRHVYQHQKKKNKTGLLFIKAFSIILEKVKRYRCLLAAITLRLLNKTEKRKQINASLLTKTLKNKGLITAKSAEIP